MSDAGDDADGGSDETFEEYAEEADAWRWADDRPSTAGAPVVTGPAVAADGDIAAWLDDVAWASSPTPSADGPVPVDDRYWRRLSQLMVFDEADGEFRPVPWPQSARSAAGADDVDTPAVPTSPVAGDQLRWPRPAPRELGGEVGL